MRAYGVVPLVAGFLALWACANPSRDRLERGVRFAKSRFQDTSRDPFAAAALGGQAEMGGSLLTYLASTIPDNADLPRYDAERPSQAWTVVLRATADRLVIIEGYGEDLARPLITDTARLGPLPQP
ncbi:MAG: hypothetical protein HYR48_05300 [Gemmatimonadetes bacterium]|nr:hypothetical protein [Gemmatimonadota bacterium]